MSFIEEEKNDDSKNEVLFGQLIIPGSKLVPQFPRSIMENSPWYHFAVFANGTVYEVTGEQEQFVSVDTSRNAAEFTKEFKILRVIKLSKCNMIKLPACISSFIARWIKEHPKYNLLGDNCQRFVQDFGKELCDIHIATQMDELEEYAELVKGFGLRMIPYFLAIGLGFIAIGLVFMGFIILTVYIVPFCIRLYGRHFAVPGVHQD
jgi:hypothetical protein